MNETVWQCGNRDRNTTAKASCFEWNLALSEERSNRLKQLATLATRLHFTGVTEVSLDSHNCHIRHKASEDSAEKTALAVPVGASAIWEWLSIVAKEGHIEPSQPCVGRVIGWPSRPISVRSLWVEFVCWCRRNNVTLEQRPLEADFHQILVGLFARQEDHYEIPDLTIFEKDITNQGLAVNVIDLITEIGSIPKRSASTNGGEYHSPCPACGGKDRFCIWPKQGSNGRYWCRQCQKQGDAIQFCRDFFGLTFEEACRKVGATPRMSPLIRRTRSQEFVPIASEVPNEQWRQRASEFICVCQEALLCEEAQVILRARGLTIETARRCGLGYNLQSVWEERTAWGLEEAYREDKKLWRQWLPRGLVVPTFPCEDSKAHRIKIRRDDWHAEDKLPKYVEISGSQRQYGLYGDWALPSIIVEAELDAILIQQEAGDIVCSIALGGVAKRPDEVMHEFLRRFPKILLSLDFDDAGKKAHLFWRRTYQNVVSWPVPKGKSPAESFLLGTDLRQWIQAGLRRASDYQKELK